MEYQDVDDFRFFFRFIYKVFGDAFLATRAPIQSPAESK